MKSLVTSLAISLLMTGTLRADTGADLVEMSGIQGGLVVHLVCGQAAGEISTADLRVNDSYIVHGLFKSDQQVDAARKTILAQGLYGPVSVDQWDGGDLPYADNMVNLIVVEGQDALAEAESMEVEMMRVLAPRGTVMFKGKNGQWRKPKQGKPWPEDIDEWNHYFHGADGNPVAEDTQVGPPKSLRWIGSPRWARHHDHMASMTSLVSARGRLFYIFDEGLTASIQLPSRWKLIARDGFNGTILWKRNIDQWNTRQYPLKSGPAHLLRRLAAVDDRVYVTLGIDAPATALDAATGETLVTYEGSQYTKEVIVSDGVLFLIAGKEPSRLPDFRRVSTNVWTNRDVANPDWGWQGETRKILAYDAVSGKQIWKVDAPAAPCSLAVAGDRVVFHDGQKLVCLDRQDGSVTWESESAPLAKEIVFTNTGPRVLIYNDLVLFAGNDGKMSGWSAADGRKLWEQKKKPSGHNSLKDLYVVDGLLWSGDIAGNSPTGGTFSGYDPATGKLEREFPIDVELNWFHHRCYPAKATSNYILTARNGTEFVDLEAEHWEPHHWVRGGCIYGVMPCNGLMYASMDACGCQLEAKLDGFKALASQPIPIPDDLSTEARLTKGPAYGDVHGPAAAADDWPTYRHDFGRSGSSTSSVSPQLKQQWKVQLGGRLSAPTAADGRLFVSSIDTHTVYALDDASGEKLWSYTTGGRVDSPPTYYRGLLLFGSADGRVYALRAEDGVLAWKFRAAPVDRRIMAWEQLESVWPVHGAVLVHDDVLYCTAGRNMYLDGGIRLLRLEPEIGKLIGEEVMDENDPNSDKNMHDAYIGEMVGNNMPVALSDILSCDGENLWMRSQKIGLDGKRQEIALQDVNEQPNDDAHLFCQIGFLDDSYFFRSYWSFGRRVTGGYGYWLRAGRLVPSGRILCYDDEQVYGFGRRPEYMTNASVLEYEFFAANKTVTPEAIDRVNGKGSKLPENRKATTTGDWRVRSAFSRETLSASEYQWTVDQPTMICRAMAATDDNVFFAGPPTMVNERRAYHMPDDPAVQEELKRQTESLEGQHGGQLWVISKQDGAVHTRYQLDAPPVFDGMIAASGRLYTSTTDGSLVCLGKQGGTELTELKGPMTSAWDQPEDVSDVIKPKRSRD